ncbi:1-acyl-sn-glycerol-3-phosphate acyltransferase [Acinetobacter sp. B5B]|nr:lysophospholipid acyltransferase family protein [Acinetobacter baretiae]MBF7683842.1 1-acyl-sn-glycerol-3-phosphate acyltransferase [Acinetobacter baretiae]MBF7686084.1 1-acyl-sn-glycerol-3-phosphate acyltransferase [Acinetobacter baretiae]
MNKIQNLLNAGQRKATRILHYGKKMSHGVTVIGEGFFVVYKNQLYKSPNTPENTKYIQWFCRKMCDVFNVKVQVHGHIDRHATALWASNHVSWLDILVLGSSARVFFLAKAEIETWPIVGHLAKSAGTLFIKRGSGDANKIREQISTFLKQDTPVLFFPEATTSDGTKIQRIHGRILGAAIAAQKPVQVALICYVNQDGKLDQVAPYYGNVTMAAHVQKVLDMPQVTAHVLLIPSISVQDHDLESLTATVQTAMRDGLNRLHTQVLH